MSKASRGWMLGLVAISGLCGTAFGQGREVEKADWKAEWLAARNVIIETNPNLEYDPTSILVKFPSDLDEAQKDVLRKLVGGRTITTWDIVPGVEHLAIDRSVGVEEALELLTQWSGPAGLVEYAEPDYIVRTSATTPNDPRYTSLWGMNDTASPIADIDAPEAWDVWRNAGAFRVAVIDTGIRKTHEDLAANIWTNIAEIAGNGIDDDGNGYRDDTWGWNFYSNNNNPNDDNGHGSHCAGTIGGAGNNAKGVVGVVWSCKFVALKFLGASGSGSTSGAISAINYAANSFIRVSNNSWGGGGYSSTLYNAINNAKAKGHIVVAAAGNSGVNTDTSPSYPASYNLDNIIAVASLTSSGARSSFSNYGLVSVDLGAPGSSIVSCSNSSDTSYATLSGTSMAAPHVTGVVTLVWSKNLSWNWLTVKNKLMTTTRPMSSLSGKCVTGGEVNANNAIR